MSIESLSMFPQVIIVKLNSEYLSTVFLFPIIITSDVQP